MIKVAIKGINESNLEDISLKLSDLGIDPAPVYRSIFEGKGQAIINCPKEKLQEIQNLLGKDYQITPLEEGNTQTHPNFYIPLLSLFLDNLLAFYLLKLSIWSEGFGRVLVSLFGGSIATVWARNILSLLFLGLYHYAFLFEKGAPPVAKLLGLNYTRDKLWIFLSYTFPLIGIYLISIGSNLFKLLGLGLLSFAIGIALYSKDSVKFS